MSTTEPMVPVDYQLPIAGTFWLHYWLQFWAASVAAHRAAHLGARLGAKAGREAGRPQLYIVRNREPT